VLPFLKRKKKRARYEEEQRAKGLIEYKGKWGTPQQVTEWKKKDEKITAQLKAIRKTSKSWASSMQRKLETEEKGTKFVNCQFCKTKFNLMQGSKCPHCGAPYTE